MFWAHIYPLVYLNWKCTCMYNTCGYTHTPQIMCFVCNYSSSWCLTLACLFTFCNSPKHFMKQIILFHNMLGLFFLILVLFKLKYYPCFKIKYSYPQGGTCTSLNRIWPAMQKIILIVLFLHLWNYWFAFMNYSLKHLSPQPLNIFCVGFHCCVQSIILTATPPRTSQQSGDYKIHSDGKNYGH